ncbi:UNVERIFIED_CONTAM: hypothetical protein FKN15_076367 [Acipenser sinensis]
MKKHGSIDLQIIISPGNTQRCVKRGADKHRLQSWTKTKRTMHGHPPWVRAVVIVVRENTRDAVTVREGVIRLVLAQCDSSGYVFSCLVIPR